MIRFSHYLILISLLFFESCTTVTTETESENDFWIENDGIIPIGTSDNLEIITWNIENFPKKENDTQEFLTKLIKDLDYDIYALQEINEYNRIQNIIDELGTTWIAYQNSNSFQKLVFIVNTEYITIITESLMSSNEFCNLSEFTKKPHFLKFSFKNNEYILVNNHFKAFSDEDSRQRRYRQAACLKSYIDDNYAFDKVIITGDLNDSLTDDPSENVFIDFLQDEENYWFADMHIAEGSYTDWSYPGGLNNSIHFDHFLLTNEIFNNDIFEINTITLKLENLFINGWSDYEKYLSDHRPVKILLQTINNP